MIYGCYLLAWKSVQKDILRRIFCTPGGIVSSCFSLGVVNNCLMLGKQSMLAPDCVVHPAKLIDRQTDKHTNK